MATPAAPDPAAIPDDAANAAIARAASASVAPGSLAGRVALVTGAGVGIGRAVALALGRAGAFVGIHCHSSRQGAQETLEEARRHAGGLILQADLAQPEPARAIVDQLLAHAGRLDVLVNNAGALLARHSLETCPLDVWRQTLDVNLTSAFLVTQRAIPALRASGHGSIINVLSLSVQTGGANGAGAYAAAKGGLAVFTRTLARELAPAVRANSVMPGVIETRHHQVATTPQRMAEYRAQTPLARNGQAEEVASTVAFLASDASSFITGAMIDISGGRFLR